MKNKNKMKLKTRFKRWFRFQHHDHPIFFPLMLLFTLFGIVVNINVIWEVKTLQMPISATSANAMEQAEAEYKPVSMQDWVFTRIEQNLGRSEAIKAIAIIQCESQWNPDVISKPNSDGSVDRGLWQINSIHKDISNTQALDYQYATDWAINKRKANGNWNIWVCAKKLNL